MLRSRDCTGFILFGPDANTSSQTLGTGEYRLTWEYRRDNTSLDKTSLVLLKNGSPSSEITELDIPWSTLS